MKLHNLNPLQEQTAKKNESEEVRDLATVEHLPKVIKVHNQDRAILKKQDLKEGRCQFREGFQSLALVTSIE